MNGDAVQMQDEQMLQRVIESTHKCTMLNEGQVPEFRIRS
jgi:hypothetical protein